MQVLHLLTAVLDHGDEFAKLTLYQTAPSDVLVLRRGTNLEYDELLVSGKKVLLSKGAGAAIQQLLDAIVTTKRLKREAFARVPHSLHHNSQRRLRHVKRRILQRRHRSNDVHERAVARIVPVPTTPF